MLECDSQLCSFICMKALAPYKAVFQDSLYSTSQTATKTTYSFTFFNKHACANGALWKIHHPCFHCITMHSTQKWYFDNLIVDGSMLSALYAQPNRPILWPWYLPWYLSYLPNLKWKVKVTPSQRKLWLIKRVWFLRSTQSALDASYFDIFLNWPEKFRDMPFCPFCAKITKSQKGSAINGWGRSRILRRKGANPPGGTNIYDFGKISKKQHEIEENVGRGVRGWVWSATEWPITNSQLLWYESVLKVN